MRRGREGGGSLADSGLLITSVGGVVCLVLYEDIATVLIVAILKTNKNIDYAGLFFWVMFDYFNLI